MKINKIRVSGSVIFFADRMMKKFNLKRLTDNTSPVVVYGLYTASDFHFLQTHKPFKIVLWRGSDAMKIDSQRAAIVLKEKNCKHYAASENVQSSLARFGIDSEVFPITSTSVNIDAAPRGDSVYCYVGNKAPSTLMRYRIKILKRLENELPYKFIYTTFDKYNYQELLNVYRKCFIGVRLLDHDGMSNSILEMGLMGRRTISNSGLPLTIKWRHEDDIRDSIEKEYSIRKEDNKHIHDEYYKLINIGEKWLEI
ncbi:MAG: hypothetical protein R6U66_08585 [Bacteroidales bacterium]